MNITVRLANEADLPTILAIYNDAILTTTAVYDYTPHTLAMRTAWYQAKLEAGFPIFVATVHGSDAPEVVGFSALGPFRAWAAYQYTVENSVYVAANRRGQGVGKLLLAPLIDAARAMEMHAIIAGVDATNVASQRLHHAYGFVEVAHFREVGYKFGRWLDLKFLELILETPAVPTEGHANRDDNR